MMPQNVDEHQMQKKRNSLLDVCIYVSLKHVKIMWAETLNPSGTNPFLFCRSNTPPPKKKSETSTKNQTEKTEAIEGE